MRGSVVQCGFWTGFPLARTDLSHDLCDGCTDGVDQQNRATRKSADRACASHHEKRQAE